MIKTFVSFGYSFMLCMNNTSQILSYSIGSSMVTSREVGPAIISAATASN